MIENSTEPRKHDRLFAFMRAFPFEAGPSDTAATANLLIVARDGGSAPTHIHYRPRAGGQAPHGTPLTLVRLDFDGDLNPLVGRLLLYEPRRVVRDDAVSGGGREGE